jgi:hypothetical protein
MARRQPKDTHWPPAGVVDIRPTDPMNAGALKVRLNPTVAARLAAIRAAIPKKQ